MVEPSALRRIRTIPEDNGLQHPAASTEPDLRQVEVPTAQIGGAAVLQKTL